MALVTIVYWRDIPAQVIVGKGRTAAKLPLPERFEQAIDRCAMKIGARDTDAYLAEWRKADPVEMAMFFKSDTKRSLLIPLNVRFKLPLKRSSMLPFTVTQFNFFSNKLKNRSDNFSIWVKSLPI